VTAITTNCRCAWFNALLIKAQEWISMTRARLLLSVSLAALMASGMAVAGEIYKWTDDDGNVHYEDRPTGDTQFEHMAVVSKNTDNSIVQARLEADRKKRDAARQVASEAPPEMTKEEIRAEQQKRQEQCQKFRDQLQSFLRSQRLYQEDDSGERSYLSEEEVLAARSRVEGQIQEYCGS
jgi:hypothetical protein